MNIAELQTVSTKEESSISITSNSIWTSARSLSEPTSPTSELSQELSDISEFNLSSSQQDHSLSNSLHPSTQSTSSNSIHSVLFNPSEILSVPCLKMPASSMNQSPYVIPPLAQMPIRGSKHAPETFKGSYKHVETFINHYNRLIDYYHVTSESDKCCGILEYCSQHVKDFIQINPHYLTPDWTILQKEILNAYDAERMNSRIRPKEFFKFIQQHGQGQITNLSQWKRYHRDYTAKAGFLKQNKQLNDLQYHGYFWYGIPHHLQGIFESRLHARDPIFDNSQPWPINTINEIAEIYFKRTKFTSQLPHLPSLGYEEDDEDESDDDYEYDSDDSEDFEDSRRHHYKRKTKKKKKAKSKTKWESPLTQTVLEEPSRKIVPPPEEKGMEGLIQRLNTMSLDDPQYGTLYYQAVSRDESGLVAACIRKPKQNSFTQTLPPRDMPPHQNFSRQMQQPYPRGILPRQPGMQIMNKCYGCFDTGHALRDCPKMAQLIHRGEVKLDPQTLKYLLPSGQPLFRQKEECLIETLNRMKPTPNQGTVQFATLSSEVNKFHSKASRRSYLQFSYSDTEDDGDEYENCYESDSERESEDEYEEGHWKYKFQQRKKNPTYTAKIEAYDEEDTESQQDQTEFPTYVAYENEEDERKFYNSYPAERTDKAKSTRQARDAAMKNPIKKSQLDGVYMPPRRFTRSTEKLPEKLPETVSASVKPSQGIQKHQETSKVKENIPPPNIEPIPVNVRHPRFEDDNEIIMKEPDPKQKSNWVNPKQIILQDHVNQPKSQTERKSEPSMERTRTGPRESDLSLQTDSRKVIEQILDTTVTLPLRQILGSSRELSTDIYKQIQFKNPSTKSPTQPTTQKVYNSSMQVQEAEITSDESPERPIQEKEVLGNRLLIQLTLYCRDKPISAIIDTGSQLNVVRKSVADRQIRLPIDISREIVMNDVNGNSGLLNGMIKNVPLRCGSVITEATDVFVGKTLPCDLLLGRPWQRGNLVSIDERREGTYLVFKDPKTSEPRYEIFITPEHLVPETFKPFTNSKKARCFVAYDKCDLKLDEETEEDFNIIEEPPTLQKQVTVFSNGKPISAIMDSGLPLNVIRKSVVETKMGLPITGSRIQYILDDKDNLRILKNVIKDVSLQYGDQMTRIKEIFVDKHLVPELILGYQWQNESLINFNKEGRELKPYFNINDQEITLPNWIIAYAPFKNVPEDHFQFKDFVYRVYFYLSPEPFEEEKLQIAYGKSPLFQIQFNQFKLDLKDNYFESIKFSHMQFLVQVLINYYITQENNEGVEIEIPKDLMKKIYLPKSGDRLKDLLNPYDIYRFDNVDELLEVATVLIHQPDGELRRKFCQEYPIEAAEIFRSQTNTFSTEETTVDSFINSNPKIEKKEEQELPQILLSNTAQTCMNTWLESEFQHQTTAEDEFVTGSLIIKPGRSSISILTEENQENNENYLSKEEFGHQNIQTGEINDRSNFISGYRMPQMEDFELEGLFEEKDENIDEDHYVYNSFDPKRLKIGKSESESNCPFGISDFLHQKITGTDRSFLPEKANPFSTSELYSENYLAQREIGRETNLNDSMTGLDHSESRKCEVDNSRIDLNQEKTYISLKEVDLDTTKLGNYKSELKAIQTTPHPHSLTMETLPGPYRPPTNSPDHPKLNCSLYQFQSAVARWHGDGVVDRTTFVYDSSNTLSMKGEHSFVAANHLVAKDTEPAFACAELVTPSTCLHFTHQGIPQILTGDAYTQFTYSTIHPASSEFHEAFSATPPNQPDHFEYLSSSDAEQAEARYSAAGSETPEIINASPQSDSVSPFFFLPSPSPSPTLDAGVDKAEPLGGQPAPVVPCAGVFLASVAGPITPIQPSTYETRFSSSLCHATTDFEDDNKIGRKENVPSDHFHGYNLFEHKKVTSDHGVNDFEVDRDISVARDEHKGIAVDRHQENMEKT